MNTSDFKDYKVDHLFLLIGENPLPNYVAARLLLNEQGGTPYLVHTTDTEEQAKRLAKILSNEELPSFKAAQLVSLNDYESDAHYIRHYIRKTIDDHQLKTIKEGKIGLNYTGGTKAMAVHAYRELFIKERSNTIFSYLDPRRLEMCIDQEDGERIRIKVKPEVLKVKLADVFYLHNWKWGSEPTYESELPEVARVFAEFHQSEETATAWRKWCDDILRKETKDKKDDWLEDKELKKVSALSLEMLQSQTEIKNALARLGVTGEALSLHIVKEQGFRKLKHVCKWLDGEWLEHYVLKQVQNIAKLSCIHESATSFWIGPSNKPKDNKFQFDVAFMRSYQLFAISCTTDSTKSLCKSKLFEAYIRAQQLGGSEARVALVCCADKKKVNALMTEVVNVLTPEADRSTKNHKLAVFGRDDLIGLSDKITEWIRNNEREAK